MIWKLKKGGRMGRILMICNLSIVVLSFAQHPWPMFRHDAQRTGRSGYAGPTNPEEKWHFEISNTEGQSSPAIAQDGTIYVGSIAGQCLYAINPDGTEKWRFNCDFIRSSPCIDQNGVIYVGAGFKLYGINPDGTEKWHCTTGEPIFSSPVLGSDGTIYIGSRDSCLYAIDSAGTLQWQCRTNGMLISSPAIGIDGTVYVGSMDSGLYAIDKNGTLKWRYQTDGEIGSSPAVDDSGIIYFGSTDSYLYALRPNGDLKWRIQCGGPITSSPAIDTNKTIYVGSHDGYLYAVGVGGSIKWRFKVDDYEVYASPIITGEGTIIVGGRYSSKLYGIGSDGVEKWHFTALGSFYGSYALDNNKRIYFQTDYPACLQVIGEQPGLHEDKRKGIKLNYLELKPSVSGDKTSIIIKLNEGNDIALDAYNIMGMKIAHIADGSYVPGDHRLEWIVPKEDGIYFVCLKMENECRIKKLVKIGR